jgi:hypothetical protein
VTLRRGLFALAAVTALAAGCTDRAALRRELRNPTDPAAQVTAVARVVETRDPALFGELISLLGSHDEGVRFAAAAALHRLTGRYTDFHFARDETERLRIREAWRRWWLTEGREAYGLGPLGPGETDVPELSKPAEETPDE